MTDEIERYAAERLEQEARTWASLSDAQLQRYRDHVAGLLAERDDQTERQLLGVLDRAIEIRKAKP